MSQFRWKASLAAVASMIIACGLTSGPIAEVQNLAETAEAFATSLPSDMQDMPGLPDVSRYLEPGDVPASEWKGIPIMPQANAGEEFDSNVYSYRIPGIDGTKVEEFYDAQLEALGWSSPVRTNVGTAGGYMLFTKGTDALSLMVTKSEGDIVVLLIMQ